MTHSRPAEKGDMLLSCSKHRAEVESSAKKLNVLFFVTSPFPPCVTNDPRAAPAGLSAAASCCCA
jgi:hypothetical protein